MWSTEFYLAMLFLPALAGAAISLVRGHGTARARISLLLCGISCVFGAAAYLLVNDLTPVSFDQGPVVGAYRISFDRLSAGFISISSIVFLLTIAHHAATPSRCGDRCPGLSCILFVACVLAMCADSVILLLLAWEMVTLTTYLMTKGAEEVHRWRYFVITHFGGLIVMCVFAGMWVTYGTCILSEMPAHASAMSPLMASVMIFLLFVGFGTKLGMIPFHSWMPGLYSSAPFHSVTLLATVSSNVAVLLLLKGTFLWIGVPAQPLLPLAIIVLAATGSVWGAMESLIQTGPRRILAYSSMENMSMVMLCLGMAVLFESEFDGVLTALMIAAAVLHTLNHSVFKALMLLNTGTVEELTGESDIDRMGGLAVYLPLLSFFAIIGTMSMAAIPPFNGFVSEWLMIKTVVTAGTGDSVLNVALPLVVAVLGITGTMAAVSYARLYGFIFLGRPRSENIPKSRKMDKGKAIPLFLLSIGCIGMGVAAVPLLDRILYAVSHTLPVGVVDPAVVSDAMDPAIIAVVLSAVSIVLYGLFRLFRKQKRVTPTWDCGTNLEPNMQYSSEGFSQPLVRVFHPFYGDTTEVRDVTGGTDTVRVRFTEPFIRYILGPVGRGVQVLSSLVGRIQSGNIQSYLAYLLVTLLLVLLVVRFI